jgi:hypothetical protein
MRHGLVLGSLCRNEEVLCISSNLSNTVCRWLLLSHTGISPAILMSWSKKIMSVTARRVRAGHRKQMNNSKILIHTKTYCVPLYRFKTTLLANWARENSTMSLSWVVLYRQLRKINTKAFNSCICTLCLLQECVRRVETWETLIKCIKHVALTQAGVPGER